MRYCLVKLEVVYEMDLRSMSRSLRKAKRSSDNQQSLLILIPGGRGEQLAASEYPARLRYWYYTAEAISRLGVDLTMACRYWVSQSNEMAFSTARVTVVSLELPIFGKRRFRLQIPGARTFQLLATTPSQVFLVLEYTPTTLLGLLLARIRRKKLWIFQEASRDRHSVSLWFERLLASRADMVIAGFGTAERDLRDRIGIPESKVKQISLITPPPNGHMMRTSLEKIPKKSGNVVFLSVARLIPLKNLESLIEAAAMVKRQGLAFEIWMVGSGELSNHLVALVHDHGLESEFKWIGEVDYSSIGHVFGLADVFVFPTWYDLYGMSAVEALRFGLPVISSSGAGISGDLVRHGDNGFVFDPGSPQEFATHMIRLTEDPDLRACMARRSLELISEETAEIAALKVSNLLKG